MHDAYHVKLLYLTELIERRLSTLCKSFIFKTLIIVLMVMVSMGLYFILCDKFPDQFEMLLQKQLFI